MDLVIVGKLVLLAVTPTALGVAVLTAPRWCAAIARVWPRRADTEVRPLGPPIERLAADLRRLLRLHGELMASAHLAMRAHRLWAIEAAIATRAVEAAQALGVPHRDPDAPGEWDRTELAVLLVALGEAGLVLPSAVGPFTH